MIAFLIHTWLGLHQNMEIFGRHLSFSCPHLFQIAIILEWNIFIYILPSKQLSDVVKKKENLPSIDSRTPISQQFAAFMIIFEGLWSFQLANLIFQEMLWQAYVRRSQYKEGARPWKKLRDANRKKGLPLTYLKLITCMSFLTIHELFFTVYRSSELLSFSSNASNMISWWI